MNHRNHGRFQFIPVKQLGRRDRTLEEHYARLRAKNLYSQHLFIPPSSMMLLKKLVQKGQTDEST